MHIPDGYLGPQTYGALFAVMTPLWALGFEKGSPDLEAAPDSLSCPGLAFCFVVMLFNFPIPGDPPGTPLEPLSWPSSWVRGPRSLPSPSP